MAKSSNTTKEEVKFEISPVTSSAEVTSAATVEEKKEEVVTPVVEVKKPSLTKQEIISKLSELAEVFRTMYGEQLNPVFSEIHKSLANAQYKIMQNL